MARKNKNAGQPNRFAQMERNARRREQNLRRKNRNIRDAVRGPGSKNLMGRDYGELIDRHEYVA